MESTVLIDAALTRAALNPFAAVGLCALLALPGAALAQANTTGAELAADPTEETGAGNVVTAASAEAEALEAAELDEGADAFPIGASVSLSYRFDHGQFIETASEDFNLGYQILSLGAALQYTVIENLDLTASMAASKPLETSYGNPGTPSQTSTQSTQLSDLSLGADWAFWTVPVAEIGLVLSGEFRLPISKPSRAAGLILGNTLSVAARRKIWRMTVGLSAGYTYNIYDDATQQIDPDTGAANILISGRDLGNPLDLQGFSASLVLGYSIIDPLNLSVSYGINNSYGSVLFDRDQYTSENAQDGVQAGLGAQFFSVAVSYRLPFETGTSVAASMVTASGLYTADNSSWRLPFFDTESQTHDRTTYGISLTQSL